MNIIDIISKNNIIIKRTLPGVLTLVFSIFISSVSLRDGKSGLDWLEDQPPSNTISTTQTNKFSSIKGYPRRSTGSLKNTGISNQALACFDIVCVKPFNANNIAQAQAINPNLSFLRIYCPQEWQGAADADNKQGNGYPFNTSGPSTANNQIFAGHFAYKPYTTLIDGIGTGTNIVITVTNESNIASGTYYYVIRPANSWANAEHVKITKSGTTISVVTRGYKSISQPWPAGSIIAQHQLGNGATAENWCYNLSTKCPTDGNGKKAYEVFSTWLVNYYDKDGNGNQSVANVDGILYDSDAYAFVDGGNIATRNADFDNDGVADWGYDTDGNNHWGEGLNLFYSGVRQGLANIGRTNVVILGGVAEAWGILPNNGTQMEAAWSHQFGEDGAIAGAYNYIGFYISGMKAQTGHGVIGPRVTDLQSKEASAIYYGSTIETRNAPVRFSYAMTMMFDGAWFSNQNGFGDAFHYFDEDAVYMSSGENYGKSVLKTNTTDIRLNNKWLGQAQGQYKRIYDNSTFGLTNNLMPNGNFETAIGGSWTGTQATVSQVTDIFYEGSTSLLVTPVVPNNSSVLTAATVTGPSVSLTASQEYTLCFAINSEAPARIIQVRLGSLSQKLFVTPGWSKHVLTWNQTSTTSASIKFDVGGELTKIWVDQLYLFAWSADVFRRDFENGIILANASSSSKTISLGGTFRRIQGNLDTQTNNGQANITQVTLPAYDGLFLIKQSPSGVKKLTDIQPSVYPNPFTRSFTVDVPQGVSKIEIYDFQGYKIFNLVTANHQQIQIDCLANKPAGIYFVRITSSGVNQMMKIVKN